jgi:hypothetical protein
MSTRAVDERPVARQAVVDDRPLDAHALELDVRARDRRVAPEPLC